MPWLTTDEGGDIGNLPGFLCEAKPGVVSDRCPRPALRFFISEGSEMLALPSRRRASRSSPVALPSASAERRTASGGIRRFDLLKLGSAAGGTSSASFFKSKWGNVPRIQLLTIEGLLNKTQRLECPPTNVPWAVEWSLDFRDHGSEPRPRQGFFANRRSAYLRAHTFLKRPVIRLKIAAGEPGRS